MRFGLPDTALEQIKTSFARYPDIAWVKIYGSRALGTYRQGSDIDIAFSSPADHSARLALELDELPTPYLFDVTHYESVRNESLKAHIDQAGQTL